MAVFDKAIVGGVAGIFSTAAAAYAGLNAAWGIDGMGGGTSNIVTLGIYAAVNAAIWAAISLPTKRFKSVAHNIGFFAPVLALPAYLTFG